MDADFPILAAVAASPTHPYQLLDHLNALGVKASRSTVYRRVDGLVESGLLEETSSGPGGHRRSLRLTEEGDERIRAMTVDVLRHESLESPLFALALSAAEHLDPSILPGILRVRMAGAARRLTEEERQLATPEALATLARERRIAHLKADVAWLQSVLSRRAAEKAPPSESRDILQAG
ncbi:MAG: helix-turn-helix transcriptional regulator [Dehalococcoidia bacterium]|nr:helix-turn-helix transcriptional regulator [Dehalococcoidia bacterium]